MFKKREILRFVRGITWSLLIVSLCWLSNAKAALAHRPHDVIEQVEVSANYAQDQTVFIIVRGNLFKSNDGGESWQRLVKGLDHQAKLSALSLAAQTKKLYVSTLGDGVYKSENGGESWVRANKGLETLQIDRLSASPYSANFVLAAGAEKGLYRTENGGQAWESILNSDRKISEIAYFPDDPNRVIIGDSQGNVLVSADRGKTWQPELSIKGSGAIETIAISPNFPSDNTFWVGTEKKGIFKTSDRGVSFTEINQGLSGGAIEDIIVSPNSPQDSTVFVSTWDEAIFQLNDDSQTWKKYSDGITKDSQADVPKFSTPHFYELGMSETFDTDKTVFLGGFDGLFKSTDSGSNWQQMETLSIGTVIGLDISPNYENDSTLALATYVGNIYISHDKGETWQNVTDGLEVPRFTKNFKKPHQDPRRFFDIAFSPNYASDQTLFSSVLYTDILRTTNDGQFWKIVSLHKGGRGLTIAPSPNFATDNTVYASNQPGIVFKSTNGGKKFSIVGKIGKVKGNDPPSLIISPDFAADKTLYASGKEGVYQSVDAGKTWKALTKGTELMDRGNIQLAISPDYKSDRTVLAGTGSGIFETQDAGKTWVKLDGTAYGGSAYIQGVALSPNYASDRTFIASVRGKGLFKTADGGQTFASIGNGSIALAKMIGPPSAGVPIQFSPSYASDRTIYGFGASTTKVFKSTDAGETWETITIPRVDNNQYSLATQAQLVGVVYRGKILRIGLALVSAILSYFISGKIGLEKRLPLSKSQLKAIASLGVFAAALIVLFAI
ncbi:MAG: YCF48-related protein [Cyanobacteriota bacterium]|nr:YCF48-related protein [Cyanobacteriota bacterium]